MGSSPLARGLRLVDILQRLLVRIIPARAGFTCDPSPTAPSPLDHPRSRGVYSRARPFACSRAGSSPLARGLLVGAGGQRPSNGIIPARAGFTCPSAGRARHAKDHPRSRGVYHSAWNTLPAARGSSPLARGLLTRLVLPFSRSRIIPARAGFTNHCSGRPASARDHPRSRGVYFEKGVTVWHKTGSSPLARGLPLKKLPMSVKTRIIPARAGFTFAGFGLPTRLGDHPRSRGVYALCPRDSKPGRGSSPLARGLRRLHDSGPLGGGIIPARAGFT